MFDNICKFIAENFSDDLATWLLGSPLPLTVLDPTELQLDPIRADSLIFGSSLLVMVRSGGINRLNPYLARDLID
jgi:predicted transposase YdaD